MGQHRRWGIVALLALLLIVVAGGGTWLVVGTDGGVDESWEDAAAVIPPTQVSPRRGGTWRRDVVPRVEPTPPVGEAVDTSGVPADGEERPVPTSDDARVRAAWSALDVEQVPRHVPWPPPPVPPNERETGKPARTHLRARVRSIDPGGKVRQGDLPPPSILVRVFAAEDGSVLRDASIEVLTAGPDGDGAPQRRFEEDALDGRRFVGLPEGPLEVRVRHAGRVPVLAGSLIAEAGRELLLDVHMELGVVLQGRLTRRDGTPAEGLRFRIWPAVVWWESYPFDDPPPTLIGGTVDAHGRVVIDAAPRLTDLVVESDGGGLGWTRVGPRTGADTRVRFGTGSRREAGEVTGRVIDADGEPVAGAQVFSVLRQNKDADCLLEPHTTKPTVELDIGTMSRVIAWAEDDLVVRDTGRFVRTDADGEFRFAGQNRDPDRVWFAIHPEAGWSALRRSWSRSTERIELRLRGFVRSRVHLRDADDAPVLGATISVPTAYEPTVLPELGGGWYGTVRRPVGLCLSYVAPVGERITYVAGYLYGGKPDIHFRFRPSHELRGVVLDADGHPLPDATVTAGRQVGLSDANGEFSVPGLLDREYRVRVEGEDHLAWEQSVENTHAELRVQLERLHRSRLQLRLPDGAPHPAWVRYAAFRDADDTPSLETDIEATLDWNDGLFTVEGVPDRRGIVLVRVPGYRLVEYRPRFAHGLQAPEVAEIDLEAAEWITGRVVDEQGEPIPRASVACVSSAGSAARWSWRDRVARRGAVRTDDEGLFRLDLSLGGSNRGELHVWADDHFERRVPIHDEGQRPREGEAGPDVDAEIRLRRGHWVEGIVHPVGGSPRPGARVWWDEASVEADEAGRFRIFVPVPVELEAELELGGQTITGTVELDELPTSLKPLVIEMR